MRKRLRHLPSGLLASAVLLILALVVGAMVRGASGALGAAAGVLLVAASFTGSSLVIAWVDMVNRQMLVPIGLFTYVVKFAIIGFAMAAIAASGWAGLQPMGIGVIVTTLGWVVAQSVWTWRARIAYVEIEPTH